MYVYFFSTTFSFISKGAGSPHVNCFSDVLRFLWSIWTKKWPSQKPSVIRKIASTWSKVLFLPRYDFFWVSEDVGTSYVQYGSIWRKIFFITKNRQPNVSKIAFCGGVTGVFLFTFTFFFLVTFLNAIHPEYVGKPEVFISHPWGNRITRLIASLINYDESLKDKQKPKALKVSQKYSSTMYFLTFSNPKVLKVSHEYSSP